MKPNPILEEVWRIKEELAREAGYDIDRYCEQLRAWTATHPHPGPRARNVEEKQRLMAEMEQKHAQEAALVLNDAPLRPKP
jgi:hypothetical protein